MDEAPVEPPVSHARPDPRILQANERTLLAWIRTGLGVMAFGFVVARLGVWLRATQPGEAQGGRSVYFGVVILALGAAFLVASAIRSRRIHDAIGRNEPWMSGLPAALALALGLAVVAVGLAAYLLLI